MSIQSSFPNLPDNVFTSTCQICSHLLANHSPTGGTVGTVRCHFYGCKCGHTTVTTNNPVTVNPNEAEKPDMVNHPPHYTSDPSGVECITITRWRNFNIGNAIKYLWRAGLKDSENPNKTIEDLEKAIFYIKDEIARLQKGKP